MSLASEIAALVTRHAVPKAAVIHPRVVVHSAPGVVDAFMTEKLHDPDYVPYCMMKPTCGRVRRVSWGFECPHCGNKMNFDLTHFDGNVNVVFEEVKL